MAGINENLSPELFQGWLSDNFLNASFANNIPPDTNLKEKSGNSQ
jgi:hypothetical protein